MILLVHSDRERLAQFANAVSVEHAVLLAWDEDEVCRTIESDHVDLVVIDASSCSRRVLTALNEHRLSRSTLVLADVTDVRRLAAVHASRQLFHVLHARPAQDELLARIALILSPRTTVRHALLGVEARLLLCTGSVLACPVLDLSNRGLAVSVPKERELLLPETVVESVCLRRDRAVLLDGAWAVVRSLDVLPNAPDQGAGYRVGLEFACTHGAAPGSADELVDEPLPVLSILHSGVLDGNLRVCAVDTRDASEVAQLRRVDADSRALHLSGQVPKGLAVGDVVRADFEDAGRHYCFLSSLMPPTEPAPEGYVLSLPRALRVRHQRRSPRVKPSPEGSVVVEVVSPFNGAAIERPVANLTASGLAFAFPEATALFPVGTRIPSLTIRFPDRASATHTGVVRSLLPARHKADLSVCGVQFEGLDVRQRAELADAIIQCRQPTLRDGTGTSFTALWNFFLGTRFLYTDKLASLDVPAVERTIRRLLAEPNDLLKTSLLVEEGRIQAHVSGVRAFRHTWFLQHLAAVVAGSRRAQQGRLLNLAVIRYLEQVPEIEWLRVWYRPTNKWPQRAFGAFAGIITDPQRSHLETLDYLVGPTNGSAENTGGEWVRKANPLDLKHIEAFFVSQRAPLLLRSDDLTSQHLLLASLDKVYDRYGLFRRREALVAERSGEFAGFALVELSSPGLNLSELTNTFRVYVPDGDPTITRALVSAASRRYGELGRPRCIALARREDLPQFESAGFTLRKQYACWTWHRSLCQQLIGHIVNLHVRV